MIIRSAQVEEVSALVDLYRDYNRPPDPDIELSLLEHHLSIELRRVGIK